jgi:saccharopine dehydrogenase (NAD+, L-lysine-forming)
MLARSFPGADVIDNKATFNPSSVNEEIVRWGAMLREGVGPNRIDGRDMEVLEKASLSLHHMCKGLEGVSKHAALRVRVKGLKKTKIRNIYFSSAGRLAPATGIPASIGALMLIDGKINVKGVKSPEQCIDPDEFLFEILTRRNVSTLNGWVDDD